MARVLKAGAGKELNAFSVHSMYAKPISYNRIAEILAKAGLGDLPLWNTEPKNAIPMRNFQQGVRVNTHFLLAPPGADFYEQFENLARNDLSATRGRGLRQRRPDRV